MRISSLCLLAFAVWFLAGCGEDPAPSPSAATPQSTIPSLIPSTSPAVSASPNPVPAGSGLTGTTTVSWNTGGAAAEIRLSTNGSEEKLFARGGATGSQEAPWIAADTNYEFRLYSANDPTQVLAKVSVTRNR